MAVFSREDCTAYQMCGNAAKRLEEMYPEGMPLDPAEASKLADGKMQMSWSLTPMDWSAKREILKLWFDRGASNLGLTDDCVAFVSAQLSTPVPAGFDALSQTLAAQRAARGPGLFIVIAAQELIALLHMENREAEKTDKEATQRVAKVSRLVVRAAARGSSAWHDEVVAQNYDILTLLHRDGLPSL